MGLQVRKRRITRYMEINRTGEVKTDQLRLPANARRVTRILVSVVPTDSSILVQIKEKFFYGVASPATEDAALIESLSLGEYPANSRTATFQASPAVTDYTYFAHPVALLEPTFVYQTFQGGFLPVGVFNVDVPGQGTLSYRLWRSVNRNLGTNLSITAQHP